MNSAQMHLALTHVPVILSITGLLMLIVSYIIRNTILTKTSYFIIMIAGIAAIPVYLTGEETEEAIEHLPGVSESIISRHEEIAKWAMISIAAAGIAALFAFFSFKWMAIARVSKVLVLVLSLVTGGLMAQTAHLGGQIRHSEIRNGATVQDGNENASQQNTQEKSSEDDD
ncbi:MAG TPA: hypothetical protein VL095_09405 [Flavisolibacter sp.]|nr:hypothetical protein [Flavisolibacter sp.]